MDENGRLKRDLHSVQNGNLRLLCQGKFAIWGKDMQKELLYSKKVREETEIQNKAAMILATMRKLHRRKCRCRGNLFFSSPWMSTPPFPSLTNWGFGNFTCDTAWLRISDSLGGRGKVSDDELSLAVEALPPSRGRCMVASRKPSPHLLWCWHNLLYSCSSHGTHHSSSSSSSSSLST